MYLLTTLLIPACILTDVYAGYRPDITVLVSGRKTPTYLRTYLLRWLFPLAHSLTFVQVIPPCIMQQHGDAWECLKSWSSLTSIFNNATDMESEDVKLLHATTRQSVLIFWTGQVR